MTTEDKFSDILQEYENGNNSLRQSYLACENILRDEKIKMLEGFKNEIDNGHITTSVYDLIDHLISELKEEGKDKV